MPLINRTITVGVDAIAYVDARDGSAGTTRVHRAAVDTRGGTDSGTRANATTGVGRDIRFVIGPIAILVQTVAGVIGVDGLSGAT